MTTCGVCCENINKSNHKKVVCPFCDLHSCRSCSQKYILSVMDDPHCMGCKAVWNREFVDTFCTKYFRNTQLRKHRENVLLEREKAMMPETQAEVERILAMRRIRSHINTQRKRLVDLMRQYDYSLDDEVVPEPIQELSNDITEMYRELERIRMGGDLVVGRVSKKFIRKCAHEECKGFMNEDFFCGICDRHFCKDCNEELRENHVCDPGAVETMKIIKKDTKPCPKCGTMIHKLSGCRQMWCPDCHTAFDWVSGQIEMGRIHNPHYVEFQRGRIHSREHGDIPCGGTPTFRELREIQAPHEILLFSGVLREIERDTTYNYGDIFDGDNRYLRMYYMLNELDEETFKKIIQRRDKHRERYRDIRNILTMVMDTGGDILRQYVLEPDRCDEIVDTLTKLVEYANGVLETLRKRYNCSTPYNINFL